MKLLVLDGNSIVNRAFYGVKLLSTKEGLFTNGIYGFLTMLQKVKDETQPDGVAIAFVCAEMALAGIETAVRLAQLSVLQTEHLEEQSAK